MTRRRRRQVLAGGLSAAVVMAITAVAISLSGTATTGAAPTGGEMPPALGAHLEKLRRAAPPGNVGMAPDGPGFASDAAFLSRAYPGSTISVAQMDRAKNAAAAAISRP